MYYFSSKLNKNGKYKSIINEEFMDCIFVNENDFFRKIYQNFIELYFVLI